MKRLLPLALVLCMLLTGCVCLEATTTVNEDGTVTVSTFMGMTTEAVNEAINSGAELGFTPETSIVRNGISYLGEYETETFRTLDEFNSDGVYITKSGNSYSIMVDAYEQAQDLEDLSGAEDASQYEELMQDAYLQLVLKMPLSITQTSGPSDGVRIDGNTLYLDLLNLQPKIYTFYAGQVGQFTDVSAEAWYYNAVRALQSTGLVNGYGGDKFGPNDNITLSAICTILAKVDGADVGSLTPGGYWAGKALTYCLDKGYINSKGDVTPANYDVPATREEVTAAISRAYAGFNADGPFKAMWADNAKAIKYTAQAEDALRQLYNRTGYAAYIVTNPGESLDFQQTYNQVFGKATNGVVVALDYTDTSVKNLSTTYYAGKDAGKAYIAGLFDDAADPIDSLLSNIDDVKGAAESWREVIIPDAEKIDPRYLADIKVAYQVNICHGIDSAGTFAPKSNITRAEVCQLFYNIHWVTPGVS